MLIEGMLMKNEKEEMVNWLKLCNVKGLGPKKIMKLLVYFGNVGTIFIATENDLLKSRVFSEQMLCEWNKLKEAQDEKYEEIIDLCERKKIVIVSLFSEKYPIMLKHLTDPPKNLFLQGDLDLLYSKKISIVGSRDSDDGAKEFAYNMAKKLAKEGITIISGGAKGIDYAAHRGALNVDGKTICVFGTGILNPYPKEHAELFKEISEQGLLISEHLPNFTGGRIALLNRNRITSGLSDALLQVTSSKNGGSSTQLRIALNQRIPVFCPHNKLGFTPSDGLLEAKKQGIIKEIEDVAPILNEVNNAKTKNFKPKQQATLELC